MKILKYICLMGLISIKFSSNIGARSMRNLPKVNQKLLQNPAQQQNYGLPMAQQNNDTINGNPKHQKKGMVLGVLGIGVLIGGGVFAHNNMQESKNRNAARLEEQESKKKQQLQQIDEKLKELEDKNPQRQEENKKNKIINIERARKDHYRTTFQQGLDPILIWMILSTPMNQLVSFSQKFLIY